MNLSGLIRIFRMAFHLNGEIHCYGNVNLNDTHSYTSDIIAIPNSVMELDAQSLLSITMKNVNSKLTRNILHLVCLNMTETTFQIFLPQHSMNLI